MKNKKYCKEILKIFLLGLLIKIILKNIDFYVYSDYIYIFYLGLFSIVPFYGVIEDYSINSECKNILDKINYKSNISNSESVGANIVTDSSDNSKNNNNFISKTKVDPTFDKFKLEFVRAKFLSRHEQTLIEFFREKGDSIKSPVKEVKDSAKKYIQKLSISGTSHSMAATELHPEIREGFTLYLKEKYKIENNKLVNEEEFVYPPRDTNTVILKWLKRITKN